MIILTKQTTRRILSSTPYLPAKLNSMNIKAMSKAREAKTLCGFPQPLLPQAHRLFSSVACIVGAWRAWFYLVTWFMSAN